MCIANRFLQSLCVSSLLLCGEVLAADKPNVDLLLAQLTDESTDVREDAAEALADIADPRIAAVLRSRVAVEKDFHARLAMHYALASQGEKKSLQPLIDALYTTGHMGANYLGFVTGEEYRWDIGSWQHWYDKTSEKDFRTLAARRLERKPMMDEWSRFANLYSASFFDDLLEPGEIDDRMTDVERKELVELPTAKAWGEFSVALTELQQNGNRKEAARRFRRVATEFPNTYYADDSRELADLLDKMVVEDEKYHAPAKLADLSVDGQIAHHVHQLRDVVAEQWSQPGYCHVLNNLHQLLDRAEDRPVADAAQSLHAIGKPAVPALIELLDDRRPIRGVGYWRNFHPSRTVLRYQDAAIQLLEAILEQELYDRRTTSSYFSTEKPDRRAEIAEAIRAAHRVKRSGRH